MLCSQPLHIAETLSLGAVPESSCAGSAAPAVCVCRFIPYLKKVFDLGSTDRVWVDAAGEYPNLLDADTKELLGYDFCDSTTDVAVIKGSAIRYDSYPSVSLYVLTWRQKSN